MPTCLVMHDHQSYGSGVPFHLPAHLLALCSVPHVPCTPPGRVLHEAVDSELASAKNSNVLSKNLPKNSPAAKLARAADHFDHMKAEDMIKEGGVPGATNEPNSDDSREGSGSGRA
eukprot:jgi/Chrzof1/6995/Cz02g07010.t1